MRAKAFLLVSILTLFLFAFTNISIAAGKGTILKARPLSQEGDFPGETPGNLPGMGTLYVNPPRSRMARFSLRQKGKLSM